VKCACNCEPTLVGERSNYESSRCTHILISIRKTSINLLNNDLLFLSNLLRLLLRGLFNFLVRLEFVIWTRRFLTLFIRRFIVLNCIVSFLLVFLAWRDFFSHKLHAVSELLLPLEVGCILDAFNL
jgi:hypothetical protein